MLAAGAALFALLACVRIVSANAPAASCTVRLRPQATVKSTALVLADIADLSGAEETLVTQLARMPLGSIKDVRVLSRLEVLSLIRSEIPNPDDVLMTGADFTRVSIATRTAEAGEIAAVVKAHLASVTPWREDEIEVRAIDNLKMIALPQVDIQLRVASRRTPANFRSTLLSVEAVFDGQPIRTFWVKADVRVRAQVVQVAKPVPYRSVLKADDLREVMCEIADPRADYIRTFAEAVGKTAKRALGPGELLSRNWVDEVRLVRSGETVRLLVQINGISVTTLARALQSGKLGDRVKVRNIDSDRAITAVVTGQGEVRVAN